MIAMPVSARTKRSRASSGSSSRGARAMGHLVLLGFDGVTLAYFVVLDLVYLALAVVGWNAVNDYVRRRPMRDYEFVSQSELSPPITLLVPAHNEGPTIVESIHALLGCHYPQIEVLIVNDGSTDTTLERLRDAFELTPVKRIPTCT